MSNPQVDLSSDEALRRFVADAICRAWVPPYRGRITEYASQIDLTQSVYTVKGKLKLYTLRHIIEPLEAIYDPTVRLVSIMGAVQTTKSLIPDIVVPYWIEHDPGDILWLFEDNDKAKKYADERALALIRTIPGIYRMLEDVDRRNNTMTRIKFAHCTLTIAGLNLGNVQTFPYRYVIIDEAWMARANGLIRQAIDRTRQYSDICKVLIIGQGGWEGEDHDDIHKQTDDRILEYACPFCGFHQPFEISRKRHEDFPIENLRGTYSGLSWDTTPETKIDGRWNYTAVGKTAHYKCFQCNRRIEDTTDIRQKLLDSYTYRATNLGAEAGKVGFRWTSEASTRLSFASQVIKFLKAKEAKEQGLSLPMEEFYQKDRGISWSYALDGDYRPIETESYDTATEWPEEKYRFLIADCQKDLKKFYVGVFACSLAGEDRELCRETAESFDDIAAIQAKWKVKDQRVFLDCGYEMTKVLRECVQRGHKGYVQHGTRNVLIWLCWTGLKGSGQEVFYHPHPKTKEMEARIYSPAKYYDVNIGTDGKHPRAPFYEWSNLHCKDLLRARLEAKPGIPKFLTLPDTLPPADPWSFHAQLHSERRVVKISNGKKRAMWELIKETLPNHELDKCAMLQAVKAICGIIGGVAEEKEAE